MKKYILLFLCLAAVAVVGARGESTAKTQAWIPCRSVSGLHFRYPPFLQVVRDDQEGISLACKDSQSCPGLWTIQFNVAGLNKQPMQPCPLNPRPREIAGQAVKPYCEVDSAMGTSYHLFGYTFQHDDRYWTAELVVVFSNVLFSQTPPTEQKKYTETWRKSKAHWLNMFSDILDTVQFDNEETSTASRPKRGLKRADAF